jgi:hypothetical protein
MANYNFYYQSVYVGIKMSRLHLKNPEWDRKPEKIGTRSDDSRNRGEVFQTSSDGDALIDNIS